MKAQEVFTPGSFPEHTYVERLELGLHDALRDALATPGMLVSIAGPSKSGKTVFVERVGGVDTLVAISGAGIETAADVWDRILDWMSSPFEIAEMRSTASSSQSEAQAGVEGGVPLFGKAKVAAKTGRSSAAEVGDTKVHRRRGLAQVVQEIANSDFVVLLDDFHYIPREVQEEVAKQLKEAIRQGVKVITAAVLHRSDDVVRANPELRGRVISIDFDYWSRDHLAEIAVQGFAHLNAKLDGKAVSAFTAEASGSPQLMQGICLNACFELGLREAADIPTVIGPRNEDLTRIFERTAVTADFRSLVDALDTGPPTRGTERKVFRFRDGTTGDVYRTILKALASDPPSLSFTYDQLTDRIKNICVDEYPVGSSVTESCRQMAHVSAAKFPRERPLDWDAERGGVLDLPDPYLPFYLRWSGRLMEPER